MKIQSIQFITQEAFERFGMVIELKPHSKDGWEVVVKSQGDGWRIAVLEFFRRTAVRLENHPSSKESFEPLKGTTVLLVAENSTPGNFEAFLLDRPVCLNEGVWHEVISLSDGAQVKITENLEVDCEYYTLSGEAAVRLISL